MPLRVLTRDTSDLYCYPNGACFVSFHVSLPSILLSNKSISTAQKLMLDPESASGIKTENLHVETFLVCCELFKIAGGYKNLFTPLTMHEIKPKRIKIKNS